MTARPLHEIWDQIDELHRRGRHEKQGRHERPNVRPVGIIELPPDLTAAQVEDFRRRWLEERAREGRLASESPLARLFTPRRFG